MATLMPTNDTVAYIYECVPHEDGYGSDCGILEGAIFKDAASAIKYLEYAVPSAKLLTYDDRDEPTYEDEDGVQYVITTTNTLEVGHMP